MTESNELNPIKTQGPDQKGVEFAGWMDTQTLKPGETRNIIPQAGLVISLFEGRTYREYYSPNPNSTDQSDIFKKTAQAIFYPDHSKESPHFELEIKLPDEGHKDIEQTLSVNKDETKYIRQEKNADLKATWRKFEIYQQFALNRNRVNYEYVLVEAVYNPSRGTKGIGLSSIEALADLKYNPIDTSKSRDGIINESDEKSIAKRAYESRTEMRGSQLGVWFTTYDGDAITDEARIVRGDRMIRALSTYISEALINAPAQENPDVDTWRNVDFFNNPESKTLGSLQIHATPRRPEDYYPDHT